VLAAGTARRLRAEEDADKIKNTLGFKDAEKRERERESRSRDWLATWPWNSWWWGCGEAETGEVETRGENEQLKEERECSADPLVSASIIRERIS